MPKLELSHEKLEQFEGLAEQYVALKNSYEAMEAASKSILKQFRDAMDILTEQMASIMEDVRDNETDKAKVRIPLGTFFTQRVMSFAVTDPEAVRKQVVEGSLPSSIYDGGVSKKAMQQVMDERMRNMGYYDLPREEKAEADIAAYAPPGITPRPYELIRFRKANG